MENQFRNDGEMPPEIAAEFPVVDQRQHDMNGGKTKSKQAPSGFCYEVLIAFGFFTAVVISSLVIVLVVFSETLMSLQSMGICAGACTLLYLVGLRYICNRLNERDSNVDRGRRIRADEWRTPQ